MTPDLPAAIDAVVRHVVRQAFDAGVKHGRAGDAAAISQAQAYAVNQVAHAWIAKAARQQAASRP